MIPSSPLLRDRYCDLVGEHAVLEERERGVRERHVNHVRDPLRLRHRITCVAVTPAAMSRREKPPRASIRGTRLVVPATEADCLAESERQSTGRT
jgi:hypothetical protein